MRLAFSGRYHDELYQLVTRARGRWLIRAPTMRVVERRIARGDERARLIYEAMAYQIAKEIGLMNARC
jgi:butyrate kinase